MNHLLLSGLLLALGAVGMALYSCRQSDELARQAACNVLVNRPWQVCSQTIQPAVCLPQHPDSITELGPLSPHCDRDDLLFFDAYGGYVFAEGPTTCHSTADSILNTGDWSLLYQRDTLTLEIVDREGDWRAYQLLHLDATRLVRQYPFFYQKKRHLVTEILRPVSAQQPGLCR